jgi:hypothetical protein
MSLPVPKLDDRRFDALVKDAIDHVRARCPGWTDLEPGDPGVTLIEVFALLTENMLYRLNRVPEKLYVTLLNLVGAQVRPPSAAATTLVFKRSGGATGDIEIPFGTQVTTPDGSVSFAVTSATVLKQGQESVSVPAMHCEIVEAELADLATPQSIRVRRPPIVAPSGNGPDVLVGIEVKEDERAEGARRLFDGRTFAIWQPAASYADAAGEARAFVVDRSSGLIVFPAPLSAGRPIGAEREIRVWYRRGGGRAGNVGAGALTALHSQDSRLSVTNAAAAAGGADGESVQSAIRRTPIEASSIRTAITARDFERAAATIGGIARAHAFAAAQQWRHADAGVVQILLVPEIDVSTLPERAVTVDAILAHRNEELRSRVVRLIAEQRPLGVRIAVDWTQVRPVSVAARVVLAQGEDLGAKTRAIRLRLNELFSPYNEHMLGRAIRASDAYEAILAEPAVRYVEQLRFSIGEAPNHNVKDLLLDPHQPRTWFAAADALHRSLDDGDSWSVVHRNDAEQPLFVRRHPDRPGLTALGVAIRGGAVIHLSYNCGESWTERVAAFNYEIHDAVWTTRDGKPLLLIATRQGLVQLQPDAGTGPAPVAVDAAVDARGCYALTAHTSPSGAITVAIAAREKCGVYLSAAGGVSGTYQLVGLKDKDVRALRMQRHDARDYLWACAQAEAGEPGEGAFRLELQPNGTDAGTGWKDFNIGWQGGSCESLCFVDGMAFAGSNRSGVLAMDSAASAPAWRAARVNAGLPLRDVNGVLEVTAAIAAAPGRPSPIVLAGGPRGVYRSIDGVERFRLSSATEFSDLIPLPPNWLYCAGLHTIEAVQELGS